MHISKAKLYESLKRGIIFETVAQMQLFAVNLAIILSETAVLSLQGDLGSGKTTFVQGLAQYWNIKDIITSPTFNYYSIYKGDRILLHLDAYRLKTASAYESLYIEDFLIPPFCYVIEWPERLESYRPMTTWNLLFTSINETHRKVQLASA